VWGKGSATDLQMLVSGGRDVFPNSLNERDQIVGEASAEVDAKGHCKDPDGGRVACMRAVLWTLKRS